jgi:hypothetical protein
MRDERLDEILRELREECAGAPADLERRVAAGFRRHHRARRLRRWALGAAIALAPVGMAIRGLVADRAAPRRATPEAPAREIATEFFALPGDWPDEELRLVRVRMPRAALASYGIPIDAERLAERVTADFVVGVDGTARAVRFVRQIEVKR